MDIGKLIKVEKGRIQLGRYDGKVVVNFGEKIGLIGFEPDYAIEIGKLLIKVANKIKKPQDES